MGLPVQIYFSPPGREILLQDGDTQQRWQWGESTHAYAGLRTPISNSLLSGMHRLLTVELVGAERIRIQAVAQQFLQFPIKEAWNGVYERVKGKSGITEASPARSTSSLQGEYMSDSGRRWRFKEGSYSLEDQGYKEEGVYIVKYYEHLQVLDMKRTFPVETSFSPTRKTYVVAKASAEDGGHFVLSPAIILVDAVELLYKPDLILREVGTGD
jgi:hypothetical protein